MTVTLQALAVSERAKVRAWQRERVREREAERGRHLRSLCRRGGAMTVTLQALAVSAPYTLHPTPYTLQPATYTLHLPTFLLSPTHALLLALVWPSATTVN